MDLKYKHIIEKGKNIVPFTKIMALYDVCEEVAAYDNPHDRSDGLWYLAFNMIEYIRNRKGDTTSDNSWFDEKELISTLEDWDYDFSNDHLEDDFFYDDPDYDEEDEELKKEYNEYGVTILYEKRLSEISSKRFSRKEVYDRTIKMMVDNPDK